jgi:hypothetical protein
MFEAFTTSRAARAGAKTHLRQGGKGALPVLRGGRGGAGRISDPFALRRGKAVEVRERALRCGHFLHEKAGEDTLAAPEAFPEV